MTFQVNDKLHGFTVKRIRKIPQVDAVMHELTHDVTGASLIYVQTKDANKLFSVAFKTIPADDTGVFHILEHSVLSGSEKYPLREPFVELLKSSMNTFLNALTFPDKTMYPVSSRNDKDFHNLVGVYLDAVFAPNAMKTPNIFYQEGWHYDLTPDQEVPTYKGVVYNEMKGAESSVDTVIRNELKKMLYGETCYGFNSGGAVDKIPTLTYEKYREMYGKYYHPTNAVFYLEGNLDPDDALAQIASYLDRYTGPGPHFSIGYADPQPTAEKVAYYDRGQEEDESAARTHITYAKLWKTFEDTKDNAAIELLSDYLTGSNETPLCRAVLESGLAEDFSIGLQDGIKQPFFQIRVTNCNYEDREKIHSLIFDTVKELIEKGFNAHELSASLNELEFQFREEQEPKALYRNMRILDSAMYGGDPMLYLDADDIFKFLREQISTGYYENLARELFDLDHMQILYMCPSADIGAEKRAREEQQLKDAAAAWTKEERDEILELNRKLLTWQQTPDTPEVLASLPKLSLSDVDPDPMPHQMEVSSHRGVTILHHGEGTPGITYLNLYFPIPWRDEKTLTNLTLLPSMLGTLSTKDRGPLDFQTDCQEHLGDLSYDIIVETESGNMESTKLYFEVSISALEDQLPEGLRLAKEVLTTTRFEEDDLIRQKLAQKTESGRRSIITGGHNYALLYANAPDVAESAVEEALHGLTAYWHLKDVFEHYDEKKGEMISVFKRAQEELFAITPDNTNDPENGVLLSITSTKKMEEVINLDEWVDAFYKEDVSACAKAAPAGDIRRKDIADKTAVMIPSGVSYAAVRANLTKAGTVYDAKWHLLSSILRFGYLWDEIRVLGGAYGTGAIFSNLNAAGFYSYRDPDPIRSLDVYSHVGEYIRKYVGEAENLDSPIISTIGAMEPLLAACDIGDHYDSAYLRKATYEKRRNFRRRMLQVKPEDLLECADVLDRLNECRRECVVGHAGVVRELEKQGFTVKTL